MNGPHCTQREKREPMCLSYSRDSKPDGGGRYMTRWHPSDIVNCICPGRRSTNEILILEPISQDNDIKDDNADTLW